MFLIDSLLLAPVKGILWLGKKINDIADDQFNDEGRIKEELMTLQLQFELDRITEQEYDRQEEELLARLDAILEAKQ